MKTLDIYYLHLIEKVFNIFVDTFDAVIFLFRTHYGFYQRKQLVKWWM